MAEISTVGSTRESRHRKFERIDLKIGLSCIVVFACFFCHVSTHFLDRILVSSRLRECSESGGPKRRQRDIGAFFSFYFRQILERCLETRLKIVGITIKYCDKRRKAKKVIPKIVWLIYGGRWSASRCISAPMHMHDKRPAR